MKKNYLLPGRKSFLSISLILFSVLSIKGQIMTQTFTFTGAMQSFTVPSCVATISVQAMGSQGGLNAQASVSGGLGGSASGILNVTAGDVLNIFVGGMNGFNGGGAPGASINGDGPACPSALGGFGGGASDIRLNGIALSNRVVVAGGGGGAGGNRSNTCGRGTGGGGGGGYYGGGGGCGYPQNSTTVPTGGAQLAGGLGGTSTFSVPQNGLPGTLGNGGAGGFETGTNQGGANLAFPGGAGGGLAGLPGQQPPTNIYTGQSGAGGSSYLGSLASAATSSGVRTGNGTITFSYTFNGAGVVGSASSSSFCAGTTVTLSASNVLSYTWSPGSSNATSITVSPGSNSTYTVQGTNALGCISTAVFNLTVDPGLPTLTVTNSSNAGGICPTKTVVLTASGATSHMWTGPTAVTNGVAFAPNVAGIYTVTGTNACGSSSAATSVSVHPLPTVIAVASTASLCSGSSLTLTTTGSNASTYTWTGGFTSGVGFVPTATSIYTVTGTSALSCTALATIPVTVVNTPTAFPTANPLLICLGNSSTLSASSASNYTWTSGSQTVFTSTMLVTPTSSGVTTYTVTKANGVCMDTKVVSLITNDLPTVLVLATPTLVCATHAASLAAAGGQTYTWTASAPANYTFTGASPVVYPAVNTTYTVAAHDGTCVNTAVISVSTNPLPTLTITPSPASGSICVGQQVSLTANGGVNYTWTTVNTTSTGATVTDSPTAAIVYNLTGDNIYGCTSTAQQVMLVYPNPTVNISITKNPMVCTGGQSTLSANGANSYTWDANAGGVNTNTAVVTSTNSTSGPVVYTVTGSYNSTGCSSSKTIAISVFIPTLTVSGNTNTCYGGNVTLSAGGGNTYSWTTAPGNPPYTFPTITTSLIAPAVFTLAGNTTTSGINCPSSMTIGLGIYYNPTITATAARTLVCKGENVDLMADGGVSYVWSNSQPGGTINVTPTNISTYTVTGTDANGCTSTGTVLVRYSACNGINEFSASNAEVVIYPNPNNGQFIIKASSDLNLTISNELGQAIRFLQLSGANEHKISIEGLSQGIYFVTGEGISQKIVVTK